MLGLLAAGLGNLAGIAGGIFIVPVLLLLGLPPTEVIGSVQAALVLPMIIASWDGLRRKEVNVKFALMFEASTVVGAWMGAFFTKVVPTVFLKFLFSMLAFMFAALIFRQSSKFDDNGQNDATSRENNSEGRPSLESKVFSLVKSLNDKWWPHISMSLDGTKTVVSVPLMVFLGFNIGFLAGMLGIAGGWVKTPLMMLVYDFTPQAATATALFMALLTVTGGTLAHWYYGHVNIMLTVPLTLGLIAGSTIAVKIKHRVSSKQLPRIIAVMLVLVGMVLLFSTLY